MASTSLKGLCLDYVVDHLGELCQLSHASDSCSVGLCNCNNAVLRFRDEAFFPCEIADELLRRLCRKGRLTDTIFTLFSDTTKLRLRHVYLRKACFVHEKTLEILAKHKLYELNCSEINQSSGATPITANTIIKCLNSWTRCNLKVLNLSGVNLASSLSDFLLQTLQSVSHLNLSNTCLNDYTLKCLASRLFSLESLNISDTPMVKDLSGLLAAAGTLKSLTACELEMTEKMIRVIPQLTLLRHLDISINNDFNGNPGFQVTSRTLSDLLANGQNSDDILLPNLVSLDISGWHRVKESSLKVFLSTHPHLLFLGLMLTSLSQADFLCDEQHSDYQESLKVSGDSSRNQIIEVLKRHPTRLDYVYKAMLALFNLTRNMEDPCTQSIILLLAGMKNFPHHLGIQMAGSATLFNLTKHKLAELVHVSVLSKVVAIALRAMKSFGGNQQLQKNCLLILYNDTILQNVSFNRFHASQLSLECLSRFSDPNLHMMSVFICSECALKISTQEIQELGTRENMIKLLTIIKDKVESEEVDYPLKFCMSALWNLTDECPENCLSFLNERGLDLFMNILDIFPNQDSLKTKVLGLLNNVAEVKHLRKYLMIKRFIQHLRNLLRSEVLEVSYFAAGVAAHILSNGPDEWQLAGLERQLWTQLCTLLYDTVLSWQFPATAVVAYRSFNPFFALLELYSIPCAQFWAVWAMQYVCKVHEQRYCELLLRDGGLPYLQALTCNEQTDANVAEIASSLLTKLESVCKGSKLKASS